MPELEAKAVQKELEQGLVWPVYWIYGAERMKSRELLKRIRKKVLGEAASEGTASWNEEFLDGSEVNSAAVVDSAQSLTLGGGTRFLVIRDAHAIKDADGLEALLGPPGKLEEIPAVCVFLSKDLDRRRKVSKRLIEGAAVVACEDIREDERGPWVQYLAKRRGLALTEERQNYLRCLEPWSLDGIDQELEKWELATMSGDVEGLLGQLGDSRGADDFLQAFFARQKGVALDLAAHFADRPDESLPLLGLLAWNVRHLALAASDREKGTRALKLSPFMAERFNRWAKEWTLAEVTQLQAELAELDFSIKQTPRLPKGLWATLILRAQRATSA